jgi:lysozyme family protein
MISNFDTGFALVVNLEGAYSNDIRDPGGETKFGISKKAYPDLDIRNLTIEQAKSIYRRDYWDDCKCDSLPSPLDIMVFDAAVNQGKDAAIKMLQRLVGVTADGVIGPVTLAAAGRLRREGCMLYMADRALRYVENKHFTTFGRGWLKRLFTIARES